MTMTGAEDYLKEIIRLQLKKPRHWNWELSTSKSSPHIALPTIQLYNTRGQLLIETNDNGTTNRQSWTSQPRDRSKDRDRESTKSSRNTATLLQRCRSDNLEKRMAQYRSAMGTSPRPPTLEIEATEIKKQPKFVQRCRSDTFVMPSQHDDSAKHPNKSLIRPSRSRSSDMKVERLREKYETEIKEKNSGLGNFGQVEEGTKNDKRGSKGIDGVYRLQKSRSDVLDIKVKSKPSHTLSERHPIRPYHKRSDSDDLIQKTRHKYNIKESLKRAENDGYKNFIYGGGENPTRNYREKSMEKRETQLKNGKQDNNNTKKQRLIGCLATAETVFCNNKPLNFEISNIAKPKRYRLRQSRAGTLVISDESFSSNHRRRCHGEFRDCRDDSNDIIIDANQIECLETLPAFVGQSRSFKCQPERSRSEKDKTDVRRTLYNVSSNNNSKAGGRHFRQSSDPAGVKTAKFPPNRYRRPQHISDVERTDPTREGFLNQRTLKQENCLFQSKSDIFPFQNLFNDKPKAAECYDIFGNDKPTNLYDNALTIELDDNCNYIVQEPLTTPGSESDKNICDSVTVRQDLAKRKRTKVKGRHSDGTYPWTTVDNKAEGTNTRPILSDLEAEELTEEKYFTPWNPEIIDLPSIPDYVVGKNGRFLSVQGAVNAAILENVNSTKRMFIYIIEGVYKETVFVPSGPTPITLYGHHNSRIVLNQSTNMLVTDWINQVNPNGTRYQEGDPAYPIFKGCAKSQGTIIGTRCSSIVWLKSKRIHLVNITIENVAVDGQAVALRSDAAAIQLDSVRLLGHQDTFYVGSGSVLVNNSYLEGDTDYVFGEGTAVFRNCVFQSLSNRKASAIIFAPKTDCANKYGFLVTDSILTSDDGFKNNTNVKLGRAWDSNVYIPNQSPNGQILIRNCRIDGIINKTEPWDQGTGGGRNFSANISKHRDLNDNRFNRFWEYQNYGEGA